MVDFCDDCGAIIMGKRGEEVKCPSCGKSKTAKTEVKINKKIDKKKEIEVVDKDDTSAEIHPLMEAECPECDHNKAFFWTKQTRAGDEPETQFFKCEKCKHQWRNYK
jgi:DNA-directed RNA polymerase subunit M